MSDHVQTSDYALRWKPVQEDCVSVREILDSNGIFYRYEVDVAIELIEDRLERGEDSDYHFIFMDQEGECVGYVCYGPIYMTDNRFDLYWIAVREDLRGGGLGKILLAETERQVLKRNGKILYVETSGKDDYLKTRAFYKKNGYSEIACVPHFYKENDDKIILMKRLAAK
jgi:ribosomal protein S18 acetylase RimI-like enzyme